mgnify:CR=1 FL=1
MALAWAIFFAYTLFAINNVKKAVIMWIPLHVFTNPLIALKFSQPGISLSIGITTMLCLVFFVKTFFSKTGNIEYNNGRYALKPVLFLMLFSYLISYIFSVVSVTAAFNRTIKYFMEGFIFLYVFHRCLNDKQDLRLFVKTTCIVVILVVVYGLYEFFSLDNPVLDFSYYSAPRSRYTYDRMHYFPGMHLIRYGLPRCYSFFPQHLAFGVGCVFFMLINLRFSRVDVARNWYISLLDRTDVNNMSGEWQYVLHAYLIGAMRNDKEFTDMASNYFKNMLEQVEATSANFSRKVIAKGKSYASAFVHVTDKEYPMLKETCGDDYAQMKDLLSDMEKISLMSIHFDEVYHMEDDGGDDIYEQIENVLYDLVNGYDDEEFKIVKNLKYNEAVIAAKGDTGKANAKFMEMYGNVGLTRTFGDLMLEWAFAEDYIQTDITVKRFALSYLKDRIKKGVQEYFEERFSSIKEKYMLTIRTCAELENVKVECDENSYDSASQKISTFYNKNKIRFIFADSYIKIFLFLCGVALLLLAVAALSIGSSIFPVALTLGITLGIVSGFLTWRRWVDRIKELNERCRLSLVRLRNSLEELGTWRKLVKIGFKDLDDLLAAIDRF